MSDDGSRTSGVTAINPTNGMAIEHFRFLDAAEQEIALDTAIAGFTAWRDIGVGERAQTLIRVAAYFRDHAERFARTMSLEMGKPIRQARAEVEKCATLCEWYASHGPALLVDESTTVDDEKAYVSYLPLGVILGIMPWNFPLWQVMRGAVPVMLAGNAFLLKHAPNVLRSAHNIAEAFEAAGALRGAFTAFDVHQDAVAATIADRRVAGVTLTGSVRAGAAVAAEAGRNVKKSLLELGGSDPFIVLADADLDLAVVVAVEARFQNCGQICIAAKRIIVEAPIAGEFSRRFVDAVRALKVGDPLDEDTYIGPMARRDLREELIDQVARSIGEGAELLLGGTTLDDIGGAFYQPTVLGAVRPGMTAFREETFGPVAAIIVAQDADEALALANDSEFGLSGALWTGDIGRAKAMARKMETGGVFINGFAASDPRVPIGGVKKSGYGRELSHFGIREFTNAQLVWEGRR